MGRIRRPEGVNKKASLALPVEATAKIMDNIHKLRDRHIAHMTEWTVPAETMMARLFVPHVLDACREGWRYCSMTNRYGTEPYGITGRASLHLTQQTFTKLGMLAPNKDVRLDPERMFPELVTHCDKIDAIRQDYAKLTTVFKWFNEGRASAATMREYCPWIQSLCPPEFHNRLHGRGTDPRELGRMLLLIREVAGIAAQALLIQGDPPPKIQLGYSIKWVAYHELSLESDSKDPVVSVPALEIVY